MINRYAIFLLWSINSCSPSHKENPNKIDLDSDYFDYNPVVLFNVRDDLDRGMIASAISYFNKCNPSVIGLEVLFEDPKSHVGDSMLVSAMKESGKMVLSVVLENDGLIKSHDMFRENILGDGIVVFSSTDGEVVDRFTAVHGGDYGSSFSFPLMLAEIHDIRKSKAFSNSIWLNREYEINFKRSQHEFKVYEYEDLPQMQCADVEGKIVIFGYLGPGEFQKHKTPLDKGNSTTYSTVIIANIVLTILNYSDEKKK
jgi:hypothetical protein